MEQKRLADKKPPIARLLMRTIRQSFFFGDPGGNRFGRNTGASAADEVRYRKTLALWIEKTGADDFRDCMGHSLQEDATSMEEWSILYKLQRRAVFTFLCVHRWTWAVNPQLCRVHRDVIVAHIAREVFRPVYCWVCGRGTKIPLLCGGCRVVMIACEVCQWLNHELRRPRCASCKEPVCVDCMTDCLARPVMEDCKAVFCSRCGPATCRDCLWTQEHMAHSSSSSSDDDDPPSDADEEDDMFSSSSSEEKAIEEANEEVNPTQ